MTHRDRLKTEEECKNNLYEASLATGSSPSHTFFVTNYTRENRESNPETERMIFDVLHYALLMAERAVKIMKQQQKSEEDGDLPPDSADGNFTAVKICDANNAVPAKIWKHSLSSFLHRVSLMKVGAKSRKLEEKPLSCLNKGFD